MEKRKLAPVALFVYNRLIHTQKTVEALLNNKLAEDSDLIIFSDAPKKSSAKKSVDEVRNYLRSIKGFRSISIIERQDNWGLARSIIGGVTDLVSKNGRVIVLEDDIVTSPAFLTFMNDALDFYEENKDVWHISGWNYPIPTEGLEETFLWRCMNCWGWATWSDRWKHFSKDPLNLSDTWSKTDILAFNLDGSHNFWTQVLKNKDRSIDTWAVFWYATIFSKNGLCLNPSQSLTSNIGNDGSGVNCSGFDPFSMIKMRASPPLLTNTTIENNLALKRIQAFYRETKPSFFVRAFGKLKKILKK